MVDDFNDEEEPTEEGQSGEEGAQEGFRPSAFFDDLREEASESPYFDDFGTPQSLAAEIVERFTPNSDYTRLDYVATVTDPATFTAPVSVETFWRYVPGEQIKPYNCELWNGRDQPRN